MKNDNDMEPENSRIGEAFRDAFRDFKADPSPEVWQKISNDPKFPGGHAKPRMNPNKYFIGGLALVIIVSVFLFTPLIKKTELVATEKAAVEKENTERTVISKQNPGNASQTVTFDSPENNANKAGQTREVKNPVKNLKEPAFTGAVDNLPEIMKIDSKQGFQSTLSTGNNDILNTAALVAPRPATHNYTREDELPGLSSSGPVSSTHDTSICKGESITLIAEGGDYYNWNTGETSASISVTPLGQTTYTVTVSTAFGKQVVRNIEVKVADCQNLRIPNAFTPNSDNQNDVFRITGYDIKDFSILIMSRTGQIIYESKDINEGWDGTIKGKPAELGVYIYQVRYVDSQGMLRRQNGQITLLR